MTESTHTSQPAHIHSIKYFSSEAKNLIAIVFAFVWFDMYRNI